MRRKGAVFDRLRGNGFSPFAWSRILVGILAAGHALLWPFLQAASAGNETRTFSARMELRDGWQYRWGDSPPDENGIPRWAMDPPSAPGWEAAPSPLNPPGREGRSILWLRTFLPHAAWQDPALLIDSRGILLTFEAYLDGRPLYRFGRLDSSGRGHFSGITSHLVPLRLDPGGNALSLRVFSDYSNIGLRGRLLLGERADLLESVVQADMGKWIIGLLILFMGLLDIFISLERPRQGTGLPFFGLYALCIGLYSIHITTLKDLIFRAPLFWSHVYILTLALMPVGIVGFIWQVFRQVNGSFLHRLWQGHLIYAAICAAAYFFALYSWAPTSVGYRLINLLRIIFIFETGLLLLVVVHAAVPKGRWDARIYLTGLAPLAFFGIHDLLAALGKIDSSRSFIHWGLLCFVLCLGWIRRRKYQETQQRLEIYSRELEVKSREKESLMKNLHDGIGGLITNIHFLAEMSLSSPSLQAVRKTLDTISRLSGEGLAEIRNFMQSLDEKEMNWPSLIAELRFQGSTMIESHGLSYEIRTSIGEGTVDPTSLLYLNLFRIHKEALTNVIKHAKAGIVHVTLEISPSRLLFRIEDDGAGLAPGGKTGKGLGNMKARAEGLGGTLKVTREKMTRVQLELPLPLPSADETASKDSRRGRL